MGKDGDKNLVVPETTVHDEASCFETNLYGPWMLVGPRRRRNPNNTRNEDGLNEKRNQTGGSHFAALDSELTDKLNMSNERLGAKTVWCR
ncbi:hypothetical protein V6N13_090599 [Hibiscus sabdariffa]